MKIKSLFISVILCLGLWYLSSSLYLISKAWLSQVLIQSAWDQTLVDKKQHKPWSWADTYPVAHLKVSRLAEETYILAGSSGRNLAFSATHLSGSGMPGEEKTTIISGHNDSHFNYLQELILGDEIILNTALESFVYKVSNISIINSKEKKLNILNINELVLTTCYPFNNLVTGSDLRYVIQAMPVKSIKI